MRKEKKGNKNFEVLPVASRTASKAELHYLVKQHHMQQQQVLDTLHTLRQEVEELRIERDEAIAAQELTQSCLEEAEETLTELRIEKEIAHSAAIRVEEHLRSLIEAVRTENSRLAEELTYIESN